MTAKLNLTSTRRAVQVVLITCATASILIWMGDSKAFAGEYAIAPCALDNAVAEQFWEKSLWTPADPFDQTAIPPWRLAFECPSRFIVQKSTEDSANAWFHWHHWLDSPPRGEVKRITFALQTGTLESAAAVSLTVCSAHACSTPLKTDPSAVGARQPFTLSLENGLLPPDANRIEITANCLVSGPCSQADVLSVYDLRIFRDDDEEPKVTINDPAFGRPPFDPYLRLNEWNNGEKTISANIDDEGAGTKLINTSVSGWQFVDEQDCGSSTVPGATGGCGNGVTPFERNVDLEDVARSARLLDGPQSLTIRASDAAGNWSDPATATFKLDRRAPIAESLSALSARPGLNPDEYWLPDGYASFRWRNALENAETTSDSGVSGFAYAIRRPNQNVLPPFRPIVEQPAVERFDDYEFPGEGLWRFTVWTFDRAGNRSDRQAILIGYDSTIPDVPAVAPIPLQSAGTLATGLTVDWKPPANFAEIESGICDYAAVVDDKPLTDPGKNGAIPGNATRHTIFLPLLPGPRFLHLRANTCAGVPGRIAHLAIDFDQSAPEISVSKPAESGWYAGGELPSVRIVDDRGGAVSARYSIDEGDVVEFESDVATLDPGDGEHLLDVSAIDAAGNVASFRTLIRIDNTAPSVSIRPPSPVKPQAVQAVALDALSGLAMLRIQYRAGEGSAWTDLDNSVMPGPDAGSGWTVTGVIPDLSLQAGSYELRAIAADASGNQTNSSKRDDGTPAKFLIPLRSPPVLDVGFQSSAIRKACTRAAKRAKTKKCSVAKRVPVVGLQRERYVSYGRTAELAGRLLDSAGEPVAGAEITLRESGIGLPARISQRTRSGADGGFVFLPKPGITRKLSVSFDGTPLLRPAQEAAWIYSKAKVVLRVLARDSKQGATVTFSGRVYAAGATIPKLGKQVKLRFKTAGGQWGLIDEAHTDASGAFRVVKFFRHADRPVRWSFRAESGAETDWPYESATSNVVKRVFGR